MPDKLSMWMVVQVIDSMSPHYLRMGNITYVSILDTDMYQVSFPKYTGTSSRWFNEAQLRRAV